MYGNAADFETYNEARGRTIPGTWDNAYIEAALLIASEWIDGIYGSSFIGYKTGGFVQEREWPRTAAVVESSIPAYMFSVSDIPERVVHATYEAAFRQATTPGCLDVDYVPSKYKKVAIEGALSVDYANLNSSADVQMQIGVVDKLLWPLLDDDSPAYSSGLSGSVSR